ncbi:MAG: cytochrome c biogenesis protein CcsA [Chloroflexi bacterium]|nr:cytochrome c biogenesis protein CcsA [Chloroflexota bacterium]
MAQLGQITLMLALALAVYSSIGSVLGVRRGVPELVVSARRAAYLIIPVGFAAAGALITAFVTNDFSIAYVHDHSSTVMNPAFLWVAFFSGNEGSLLFIALAFATMGGIAIYLTPARFADALPYTIAIITGILAFFFFTIVFFASPFESLGFAATEGLGINPLLTHPGMFIHPPLQMAGLVGIGIPFAFAMGSLIAGKTKDEWLDMARVSAILIWAVLGTGMLIGAWWAYTILGWGGYWSWDPIENVAFMPFLVLTTFIHTVMVQKRRGMFRMWNIVLLSAAFVLAQFGMFINRGGPVVSVHSFGASTLGVIFLAFMLLSMAFALAVFFWRYNDLKSDRPLESFLSREASFLLNNFLLLGIVGVTLWGVLFPLASEFAQNTTVTVSAPYFNQINGPLLLGLVFLMGVGPVLPWRRASTASLKRWLLLPAVLAVLAFVGLVLSGLERPVALFAFSVLVFVAASILQEWYRGAMARRRGGDNIVVGFWKLINGNRPRHGGYVVHLSILVLAFGVIGTQFYDQRQDAVLNIGESVEIDNYRIEFVSHGSELRADRLAQWANLDIYKDGKYIGALRPWSAFYPGFNQVSVRAGIDSGPVEDLYIIPTDFLDSQGRAVLAGGAEVSRAVFRISINPLAWWLWFSGPIFLLGTVIALWPQPAVELRTAPVSKRRLTGIPAIQAGD